MTADDHPASIRVVVACTEVDRVTLDEFVRQLECGLREYEMAANGFGVDRVGLVVDLTAVRFLDSSGIQALVDADVATRTRGGSLTVVGAGGVVLRCLEITGLAPRMVES